MTKYTMDFVVMRKLKKAYTYVHFFRSLYKLAYTDSELITYKDIIESRLTLYQMIYEQLVTQYVTPHLPNSNTRWYLNFFTGDLIIYE